MSSVRRAPPGAAKGMSRATSASPASMPRKRSNRTTGADLMRAKRSDGAPRRTSSPRAIRMVLLNRRTTNGSSTSGTDASIVETMAMTAVARASGPRPAAARVRTAATRLPTTSHAESSGALTPRVSSVRLGAGSTIQDVRNNRTRTAAKRSGDATGGLDLGCRNWSESILGRSMGQSREESCRDPRRACALQSDGSRSRSYHPQRGSRDHVRDRRRFKSPRPGRAWAWRDRERQNRHS